MLASAAIGFAVLGGALARPASPRLFGHTATLAIADLAPRNREELRVASPAFKTGGAIPLRNTQYGGNLFPGLAWTKGPSRTRSYVVIVQSAPAGHGPESLSSIHLVVFNIPAGVTRLEAGMQAPPAGATFGPNVHGFQQPYAGPHTHTTHKRAYHLEVFALDKVLPADPRLTFEGLEQAMRGHVLASGETVGFAAMPGTPAMTPSSGHPT